MSTFTPGPLIAKGRTAEVYAWQENQILKLFYTWVPSQWVQNEIGIGHTIKRMKLPTPRMLDVLEIGDRQGIIYERVDGLSMLRLLNTKPWLLTRLARQLAELHSEIHKHNGSGLPHLDSSLRATIQQVENLPPSLKTGVLRLLEKLPDDNVLCHFDFHPDQVLVTAEGPVIIDWMTAHQGHPLADVARTSIIFKFGQVPNADRAMRILIHLSRSLIYRTYIARYLELHPGVDLDEIRTWMIPIAASRLKEQIQGEQEPLLRFIQSYLLMQ